MLSTDPHYTFAPSDVTKRVREIAQANPDFVYTEQPGAKGGCSYLGADVETPDVGQACIVGQALQDMGVSREHLEKANMSSAYIVIPWLLGHKMAARAIDNFSEEESIEIRRLNLIQFNQDEGHSWSNAVYIADKVFNNDN